MNIAILIGISKYTNEADLPACSYDVNNLRSVLVASKKYDDIESITDNTESSQVKDKLRAFFAKYQNSASIDEVLVYFSGHGTYQSDALLCCSDYDSSRPATTSISNSELDDLLRSVSPDVAVKIIDACQSGAPYIKDANIGFEKSLKSSQLNSFICMSSSKQNQSSFASATESYFTARWIDSALAKKDGRVLYRDIQAALADAFVSNPEQTPFFVNQGTGLEFFAEINDDMRGLATQRKKGIAPEKPDDAISQMIAMVVSKKDREFVPHEKALEAAEKSKNALVAYEISDQVVKSFYSATVSTDSKLSSIPKSREVANFAADQNWQKQYFVKVNEEQYKVRVPKDPFARMAGLGALSFGRKFDVSETVIETKTRPSSLETTEPLPFEVCEVLFTSQHRSLLAFRVFIGVVHSLTEMMVISSAVRLNQKGWDSRAPELSEMKWKYVSYPWVRVVEEPSLIWNEVLRSSEATIRHYLEGLMPTDISTEDDASINE